MQADQFTLANKIAEAIEAQVDVECRGYIDAHPLSSTTLDGHFNLIAVAASLLKDFRVEVR